MARLPLEGIRITDLTQIWAGPKCTQILADLGAEVIKIESPRRSDPARGTTNVLGLERYPGRDRGQRPYNRSGYFNSNNRSKYGITLDLHKEEGLAIFRRLVELSDVVTENFSATVMARLGLSYETLKTFKSNIIMLSMPGFGGSGPERDYVAWATTIEATAGFCYTTGYEGKPPMVSYQSFSDPLAGIFGAVAVLTALRYRRTTGKGQHIDLSQLEALVNINAEALLDYQINGRLRGRHGNHHWYMAPHGVYPCRGQDSWVALAISTDREWQALRRAMGDPEWASDDRFSGVTGRKAFEEELDRRLADWTRNYAPGEVTNMLQDAGVASGPALTVEDVVDDPHLMARGDFESVTHDEVGPYPYYRPLPVKFSKVELKARRGAPCFGQDNESVLVGLLGLSKEDLVELEREQVISSVPLETIAMMPAGLEAHSGRSERS